MSEVSWEQRVERERTVDEQRRGGAMTTESYGEQTQRAAATERDPES